MRLRGKAVNPAVWLWVLISVCRLSASGAELRSDIEYGKPDGVPLLLDAKVPDGPGPFPAAIIVHGGGWSGGDKQKDITVLFDPLTAAKFTWFSINYRLAPQYRYPACLEDVETAIRWVKAHTADFKADPRRIAIIGYSAGGHLATMAALHENVAAVVGLAAPTDMVADTARRGGLSPSLQALLNRKSADTTLLREISPLQFVKPGLPPFLLIHGTADKSVPYAQSLTFKAKLEESGVPCDLVTLPGAPHNIGQWDNFDLSYKQKMMAWLERTLGGTAVSKVWVSDNGDGTYKNPVLHADYSDPDVIRVGSDFYMTASSFNSAPGLPILHSKDLVNWQLIGHALDMQIPADVFSKPQHGKGVWAPAIRYHDSVFYLFYPDPDYGIYLVKAESAAGPWSEPVLIKPAKGWIDPCPLWDDDGKAYLVTARAASRSGMKSVLFLNRMAADGSKLLDEGTLVYDGHAADPTIEGPKMYKRNGYYYISAPAGGVPTGWQVALRSKSPYGPYERKVVLQQGKTPVNGPHQGAWVDTPSGEFWFVHFQDKDAYGRVTHLEPMRWVDDWPVIGNNGEPVLTYRKPDVGGGVPIATPPESDEFERDRLGLQWQWEANPKPDWASLLDRSGWLRLFCVPLPEAVRNFWDAPNLLLQKFPAPEFTATTKVSLAAQDENDKAGLIVAGLDYAYLSVKQKNGRLTVAQTICRNADRGASEQEGSPVEAPNGGVLYLRVKVSKGAVCHFSYSADGNLFQTIGETFTAKRGLWVGAKVGLFAVRKGPATKYGHADFDWFRVEKNAE